MTPVITVDGPSGAGKGTLCQWLATRLNWHLLDSGALYRVTAWGALNRQVSLDDESALAALARELPVSFAIVAGEANVFWDSQDISREIRNEQCAAAASRVAALLPVRQSLLERQRAFRQPPGLVADGRDMGTVVFPDATAKIFLTASAEARAKRRYIQLKEKGIDANLAALVETINERDARDANRASSPLKPAVDALILDSTQLDIDGVKAAVGRLLASSGLSM